MANTVIAYNNVYTLPNVVSITATSEETGYPKENAYDWLTYDGWQPQIGGVKNQVLTVKFSEISPQAANFFYVYSPDANLYGTHFRFQYSDDDITYTEILTDTNIDYRYLRDVNSMFRSFTEISHPYYRFQVLTNENYMLYSEEFDHATYTKTATVTANQEYNHLGELVADKIEDTSASVTQNIGQSITVANDSATWQYSLYIIEGNTAKSRVTLNFSGGVPITGYLDITWATKSIAEFGPVINEGIEQVEGTNIYRVWFSVVNDSSGNTSLLARIEPASDTVAELGYIYAYGLQVSRSKLKEPPKYIKTTSAAVTNPHGVFPFVMIGDYLQLEQTLPVDAGNILYEQRDNKYINNVAQQGTTLGRSLIRKGTQGTINLRYITPTWFRANWPDFMDHAEQKPFVFCPDPDNNPDEAVLCYLDGKQTQPRPSSALYLNASLKIRGFR